MRTLTRWILRVAIYVVWIVLATSGILDPNWMKPVCESLIAWLCLIALLGYGRQFLNSTNRFLRYFGEASYALHILHQTVIVIVGYYVVQWSAGVLPKLLVTMGVSFLITLALYDLVVKRTNVTRFLFGMLPLMFLFIAAYFACGIGGPPGSLMSSDPSTRALDAAYDSALLSIFFSVLGWAGVLVGMIKTLKEICS